MTRPILLSVSALLILSQSSLAQEVKIGLLVQEKSYTSALRGAELAVRIANEKGGLNGIPFRLAVRSMEGPWGTGSKQAVDLIFNEKVWALLGSHDGRNAHLVEQAATRSTVVFVSAWSSDPTLAQAFVPWFFNCVPNDDQQATALAEEIFVGKKFTKTAVVIDDEYESECIHKAFMRTIKLNKYVDPSLFVYKDFKNDPEILLARIRDTGADCIVLFCNPENSRDLFRKIKENNTDHQIYGALSSLNEDRMNISELTIYDNSLIVPASEWQRSAASEFIKMYRNIFGTFPGMVAAYSYDGVSLLLDAMIKAGSPEREKIQAALENNVFNGITGIIRFDDMGNRDGRVCLTRLKNGIPLSAWE